MTQLEQAIALVEDMRDGHRYHVKWLERLRRLEPDVARSTIPIAGGIGFHRKAARQYDFILRVLRRCQWQADGPRS
jgi:hypothetical protein